MPMLLPTKIMHIFYLCVSIWFAAFSVSGSALAYETKAKAAFVLDLTSGTILLAKNADTPLPPASMSKLMTLYVAFEFIKAGQLQLEEKLPVSSHAAQYGGSTMFLDTTDRVSVEDLLKGIIVLSGNDACAVIAEALSPDGTEAGFARLLTQRAQQLGMTNSTFRNSNGWPATGHMMSTRDLALLAKHLIVDFPEFYPMFAEKEFAFDGRAPANSRNRNPLLGLGIGADGLKTGHTNEAGYGLTGSAVQGDRRIVFVISGLASTEERAQEAEAIVNWAFRQFSMKSFGKKGTVVAEAPVWNGAVSTVGLVLEDSIEALVPVLGNSAVNFELEYKTPIPAPILQDQELGTLIVNIEGLPEMNVPLLAQNAVPVGGFMTRIMTAAKTLLNTIGSGPEASL